MTYYSLKPKLSIPQIGKVKFYIGIFIGIISSFVFVMLINTSREIFRTGDFTYDPIILEERFYQIWDLFYSTLSVSMGFGFTLIFWFSGRGPTAKKRFYYKIAFACSYLVVFSLLMVIARLGMTFYVMDSLRLLLTEFFSLKGDFTVLLFLLPLYLFFVHWNYIRIAFRTGYWMSISFVACILLSFVLFKTATVDRDVLNQLYYGQNSDKFEYIDDQFEQAKDYGILFSDSLKTILRSEYSSDISTLVEDLKIAMYPGKALSIDTLILTKIVIHNVNHYGRCKHYRCWPFVDPRLVRLKIDEANFNDVEVVLLFEILKEQIDLFNTPEIPLEERSKFTKLERKRSAFNNWRIGEGGIPKEFLKEVVIDLKSDSKYQQYHHLLPEIHF